MTRYIVEIAKTEHYAVEVEASDEMHAIAEAFESGYMWAYQSDYEYEVSVKEDGDE